MKKIGSLQFFEDVNLHLDFDFNDLMDYFDADELGVKQNFLDENQNFNINKLDLFVEKYVNDKIKEKYGDDFSLDVMDDTMNISWNIDVKSIQKRHIEDWWNKEENNKLKLPKLKKA